MFEKVFNSSFVAKATGRGYSKFPDGFMKF